MSVFSEFGDAKNLLKLPKFKKANIAEVHLQEQDGKIKKTFDLTILGGEADHSM